MPGTRSGPECPWAHPDYAHAISTYNIAGKNIVLKLLVLAHCNKFRNVDTDMLEALPNFDGSTNRIDCLCQGQAIDGDAKNYAAQRYPMPDR